MTTTTRFHDVINTVYHAAVITGLAAVSSKLTKLVFKGSPTPKLDFDIEDLGLELIHISSAMLIQNYLVKNNIIPENVVT